MTSAVTVGSETAAHWRSGLALRTTQQHGRMSAWLRLTGHPAMETRLSDPETWLHEHGDSLYRFALQRTGDPAKSEDLVQDTLIAALQSRDRFSGNAQERTWLIGILKHKVIDHLRIRDREVATDFDAEPDLESEHFNARGRWQGTVPAWHDPDSALQQDAFFSTLEQCIDALPQRAGEAFRLRELHGLDTDEICAALEIGTANNLFVILSRARMSLRDCLTEHWFQAGAQETESC